MNSQTSGKILGPVKFGCIDDDMLLEFLFPKVQFFLSHYGPVFFRKSGNISLQSSDMHLYISSLRYFWF